MRSSVSVFVPALLAASLSAATQLRAEADGPDFWDVTGVEANDVLNLHSEASARSRTMAGIPHDARGLKNLGCTGAPTFAEWTRMSEAERVRSARARWCKVQHDGRTGWVAGRFLKEGSARAGSTQERFGPWTLACKETCAIEQRAVGSAKPVMLRLEAAEAGNPRIVVERAGMPRKGTLTVYMDGDTITTGPIAQMAAKDGKRLVMPPDDITLGLVKQMKRRKNMVLSFPGEERGAEIHLDHFGEAWQALEQAGPGR